MIAFVASLNYVPVQLVPACDFYKGLVPVNCFGLVCTDLMKDWQMKPDNIDV